jgi:hypothetical protein
LRTAALVGSWTIGERLSLIDIAMKSPPPYDKTCLVTKR